MGESLSQSLILSLLESSRILKKLGNNQVAAIQWQGNGMTPESEFVIGAVVAELKSMCSPLHRYLIFLVPPRARKRFPLVSRDFFKYFS